jgi:hypothetical protein
MKDEAQQRRARAIEGLSDVQRLEFYRQADEALRRRQEQLRRDVAMRSDSAGA